MAIFFEGQRRYRVNATVITMNPVDLPNLIQRTKERTGSASMRFTYDESGNRYWWAADDATHYMIEPCLSIIVDSRLNQSSNFKLFDKYYSGITRHGYAPEWRVSPAELALI